VFDKNHFLSCLAPNRRRDLVCDLVFVLQLRRNCACTKSHAPNRDAILHAVRVNGSNSVSDTKSQIHQIASVICSKSHALNRSCNQPLSGRTVKSNVDESFSFFPPPPRFRTPFSSFKRSSLLNYSSSKRQRTSSLELEEEEE
jgi:hypothetical protein